MITIHDGPGAFLLRAQSTLEQNEAAHGLMLGLALRDASAPGGDPAYYATVGEAGDLSLAAMMTPRANLILYAPTADGAALASLAADLQARHAPVIGVLAEPRTAAAFATLWSERSGRRARLATRERVYELRQVVPPRALPGQLRVASDKELELVTRWLTAFRAEAGLPGGHEEAGEIARRRLARGEAFIWEDGAPVSMAGKVRATPHGATVGMVYTPPEFRRRGYASACVAALSQRLLDAGYAFCTLFTDLANPISNSIYQQIGYRPVCDYDEYRFEA